MIYLSFLHSFSSLIKITSLIAIFHQSTTAEVKFFCLLKSMKLIGSLNAHDHEYLIPDVGPVLVELGKVLQARHQISAEFQPHVDKAINELVNDINRDFRMTKLPIYVGKLSKFIPLQYKIGMYDMSDSDLDALLNIEEQDIRSVC